MPSSSPPDPLSLHDALPIFWRVPEILSRRECGVHRVVVAAQPLVERLIDGMRRRGESAADHREIEILFRRQMLHVFETESLSQDRKSTRLNSSHVRISYAVFLPARSPFPTRRSSDLLACPRNT